MSSHLHLVHPPRDYASRTLESSHNHIDLYRSLEEEARIHRVYEDVRRDLRIMRLRAAIHWCSIGLAVATAVYFAVEFAR